VPHGMSPPLRYGPMAIALFMVWSSYLSFPRRSSSRFPISTLWRGVRWEVAARHLEGAVRRCDNPHNTSVSNGLAAGLIAGILSAPRFPLPALERRETWYSWLWRSQRFCSRGFRSAGSPGEWRSRANGLACFAVPSRAVQGHI